MNRAEKRRQEKLAKKAARNAKSGKSLSRSPGQQAHAIQETLSLAVQQHNAGDLPKAEGLYLQVLQADPKHPVALHLLGVIALQVGKFDAAVELIGKALVHKPDYVDAHSNLGNALSELNKLDEAVASYRNALAINPDYAEGHFNLGNTLKTLNKIDEAIESYDKALTLKPDYADAHTNLGVALKDLGKLDAAIECYHAALAIRPGFAEAHVNLGNALNQQQKYAEAIASFRNALAINPHYVEAHNNIGNALKEMNQFDAAVESFRLALAIKPDYLEAHYNLGNTLKALNKLDEAVESYHKVLAINPAYAEAHSNLGVTLNELNKPGEAVECYRKALAIMPDYADAHYNLGNALHSVGKMKGATASFRKALALKPDNHEAHSNLIFLQDFIADLGQSAQQAERKLWDNAFILPQAANIKPHANNRDRERPLRIGYVSADFRHHSAHLGFGPLLMDFDRQNFQVICYDATILSDPISAVLQNAATDWRAIRNISNEELADTIRADAIDILVDLSGHTRGNRLMVFGHKPAPLQISGIGHLAPGVSTIDYRLTTDRLTPADEESIYPEQPIYLDTFFGFTEPISTPPLAPPPCLQNGFITFGFLGRFSKTSDDVFAMWARILRDVPGSRLLLKYRELDAPADRQKIKDIFSHLGIGEERLILLGKTEQREHLEAHNRVDMVLDTFPHGGGITTMDSLWMGVPVIGLADKNKAGGRIIDCVESPVGLEDWVARDLEQYHAIALQWAGQTEQLAHIRQQLRKRVSDVYFRFPQDVEKSYRLIWQRWCAGEQPSPLYPLS